MERVTNDRSFAGNIKAIAQIMRNSFTLQGMRGMYPEVVVAQPRTLAPSESATFVFQSGAGGAFTLTGATVGNSGDLSVVANGQITGSPTAGNEARCGATVTLTRISYSNATIWEFEPALVKGPWTRLVITNNHDSETRTIRNLVVVWRPVIYVPSA